MRTALAIVVPLCVLTLLAPAVRADDAHATRASLGESQPVYGVAGRLTGRRVESVLMGRRGPTAAAQPGTGWLLHAGTQQRGTCDRADATSGLRMLCVGW